MEEKEDDFTFCQVERNLASDVDGIKINDEVSNSDGSNRDSGILWKEKLPSKQQDKFGSLAFNVIDASPSPSPSSSSLSSSESSKQVANADVGTSVKNLQEQKVSTRKPAARTKVPFEKGYSQMDWLKLTRTHPDLAGLKGQSNKRLITMDEVKKNRTGDSMWTVLKGRVYNLSPYMKFHPGGVDMLMKAVGKDCTSLFNKYHAWVNAEFLLEKCLVGMLDDSR